MQSDLLLVLCNNAKKCSVTLLNSRIFTVSTLIKVQSTRRSVDVIIGRTALKCLAIQHRYWVFSVTIWRMKFIPEIPLNKILNFIAKPEVCEMGENFRLQYGLSRLYRVWSCTPGSQKVHILISTWCFSRFSKSLFISQKMQFLKLRKNYVSSEISTFQVFISLVDHTVHIRTKTCMKITFK